MFRRLMDWAFRADWSGELTARPKDLLRRRVVAAGLQSMSRPHLELVQPDRPRWAMGRQDDQHETDRPRILRWPPDLDGIKLYANSKAFEAKQSADRLATTLRRAELRVNAMVDDMWRDLLEDTGWAA